MAKSKKSTSNRQEGDIEILQMFGDNLRKCREKRKLTQEQLAYEAGFSRSYYTEVETGKRNISLLNIIRIASLLQVELSDLVRLKDLARK
jgi:transcriptional regulator with XRE-family HTH domain